MRHGGMEVDEAQGKKRLPSGKPQGTQGAGMQVKIKKKNEWQGAHYMCGVIIEGQMKRKKRKPPTAFSCQKQKPSEATHLWAMPLTALNHMPKADVG